MDSSKIKNFIIIVLLLVNVFMLALVLVDRNESRATQREAEGSLALILSENGIALSGKVKLPGSEPESFKLVRDLDGEKKVVAGVLGKTTVENLGGNIYFYSGANGQARFRGSGEFEMLFESGAVSAGGDPVQAARRLLRKMGIDSDRESADLDTRDDDQTVTVTLNASWQGGVIYNCKISFTFKAGSLILVEGRRPLDRVSDGDDGDMLSAATVIMRFLDAINSGGHVCSEIRAIEQGYVLDISAPGDGSLSPVWKIETDTGGYYINGISGEVEIL